MELPVENPTITRLPRRNEVQSACNSCASVCTTKTWRPYGVSTRLARENDEIVVRVAGMAADQRGNVSLVAYVREAVTKVAAGENGGRTLANANIVRSVERLGPAGEAPATWRVPAREGLEYAVHVQGEDGRILGAAAPPR